MDGGPKPDVGNQIEISAVVPVYQAAATLERCLRSALDQSEPADEIWVIDDGSTDGSSEIARRFGDPVRVRSQPNAGAAAARNLGIESATRPWIAFLDADDEWRPTHLADARAVLGAHPELHWFASAYELRDGASRGELRPEGAGAGCDHFPDYFAMALRWSNITPSMVVRADVFDDVGRFDPTLVTAEDIDLWFRIALAHPAIGYADRIGAVVHRTPGSLTESGHFTPERALAFFARCDARLADQPPERRAHIERFMWKWVREALRRAVLAGDRAAVERIMSQQGDKVPTPWRAVAALTSAPRALWWPLVRGWEATRPLRLRARELRGAPPRF